MSSPTSPLLRFLRRLAGPPGDTTDADLLGRFASRHDEEAFTALVQRHGPMVMGVCRRLLGNHHDAEDAFQATFLVLARKARSVGRPELLGNWLYGVASRTALKARARAAERRRKEGRAVPPAADDPTSDVIWADLRPVLDEEVSRLPDRFRIPFVLCYLEGRTNEEAARTLGCPKGTVLSRLATARERLRSRLTRRGIVLSAGAVAALTGGIASAAVPPALIGPTVKAALGVAAGQTAAGLVSAQAAALMKGTLRAMLLSKLKVVALAVVAAAVLGGGATLLTHRSDGKEPGREPKQIRGEEAGKEGEKKSEDAAAKELKAMEGAWDVIGIEEGGRKASADDVKGMRWTFKGSEVEPVNPGEKRGDKFTVKLDPGKTPKHIDVIPLEGDLKGKTLQGIYKLEDGQLTICLRDEKSPEKGRPTEFSGKKGSDQGLITLKKAKK
jgi:RNA polymerase sigma factor (sigma-70 family)